MTHARLRIVGNNKKPIPKRGKLEEIRLYYFPLETAAHNLDVPERWILKNLEHLADRIKLDETWYFSPDDYHKLRELRDA